MTTLLALALAFVLDEKDDVAVAAKKIAEAKSYSYKGSSAQGRVGGDREPEARPVEGKHESGVGSVVSTDAQQFVRIGDKTAVCPKPVWRVIQGRGEGQPQRPNPGQGGGQGGQPGAGRLPHEDLADFGAKLEKATKGEAKETLGEVECDVYSFTFTADAAKALAGPAPGPRGGGEAPAREIGATGRAWIREGALVKIEIKVVVKTTVQDRAIEFVVTRVLSFFDVDATKVEIPEEAKKAIEEAGKK
jgi:hypothetical protein